MCAKPINFCWFLSDTVLGVESPIQSQAISVRNKSRTAEHISIRIYIYIYIQYSCSLNGPLRWTCESNYEDYTPFCEKQLPISSAVSNWSLILVQKTVAPLALHRWIYIFLLEHVVFSQSTFPSIPFLVSDQVIFGPRQQHSGQLLLPNHYWLFGRYFVGKMGSWGYHWPTAGWNQGTKGFGRGTYQRTFTIL